MVILIEIIHQDKIIPGVIDFQHRDLLSGDLHHQMNQASHWGPGHLVAHQIGWMAAERVNHYEDLRIEKNGKKSAYEKIKQALQR